MIDWGEVAPMIVMVIHPSVSVCVRDRESKRLNYRHIP